MKRCSKCKAIKRLSLFYPDKRASDGLKSQCNTCTIKGSMESRQKNKDHYLEYNRSYRKTANGKASQRKIDKKCKAKNPEKYKARMDVNNAIRSGKLKSQPCMICGNKKVEAHHTDYTKPLDVAWLCKGHHTKLHAIINKHFKH